MNQELQDSVRFSDLAYMTKVELLHMTIGAIMCTTITNKQHHATIQSFHVILQLMSVIRYL